MATVKVDKPADDRTDLDTVRAEVANESRVEPDGSVRVPLRDTTVRVLNVSDWPCSANEDQVYGRYATWARKALHPADRATWAAIDPTNREVAAFTAEWETLIGIRSGE